MFNFLVFWIECLINVEFMFVFCVFGWIFSGLMVKIVFFVWLGNCSLVFEDIIWFVNFFWLVFEIKDNFGIKLVFFFNKCMIKCFVGC